jgi:hypothetical protein
MTHVRATWAGTAACLVKAGSGYPRRPLSEFRGRCDTYTNLDTNRVY